jgi:hypothetical protein
VKADVSQPGALEQRLERAVAEVGGVDEGPGLPREARTLRDTTLRILGCWDPLFARRVLLLSYSTSPPK